MMRRYAKEIVRKEVCAHQIWNVLASGFLVRSNTGSTRNGDSQRRLISSWVGHDDISGREDLHPVQGFGIVKNTVPHVRVISSEQEDVPRGFLSKERITEEFGITGKKGHRWWIGRTTSSLVVGYYAAERSSSQWRSSKPGRSADQSSSRPEPWNRHGTMRMLSTKLKDVDGNSHSSSEENETQTEDVPARPKSIDDFQHEEIVGPTVERDESETANQLRESLGELTKFMTNLRDGFVVLGSVQLVALLWSSAFHGVGFFIGLSQDFSLVMSFVLAYLLRVFGSRVDFFSKIEARSRMRILTLSLQANKMLSLLFFRSTFVVKAVALCSLVALFVDIWHTSFTNL